MYDSKRIFVLNEPVAPRLNPALAAEIGLNESIILLQMEYWIATSDNVYDNRKWTYQSVRDMQDKIFGFWSISTINRAIKTLIDEDYIIEGNYNKMKFDKTRWFALNYDRLSTLKSITVVGVDTRANQNEPRTSQNETTIPESSSNSNNDISCDVDTHDDKETVKELNDYLKSKLPSSVAEVLPRTWERNNSGTIRSMLKKVSIEEIKACIDWGLQDKFWKDKIDKYSVVVSVMVQYRKFKETQKKKGPELKVMND
jgi:hypothetical protein